MSGLRFILIQILRFGRYAGVHVLLVSRLVLFNLGWCFFYLGFLLFLPITTPIVVQLLLSFGVGLVGFGVRMAGGCTVGHGLNGCSRLQRGSLLSIAVFFSVGIAVALTLSRLTGVR